MSSITAFSSILCAHTLRYLKYYILFIHQLWIHDQSPYNSCLNKVYLLHKVHHIFSVLWNTRQHFSLGAILNSKVTKSTEIKKKKKKDWQDTWIQYEREKQKTEQFFFQPELGSSMLGNTDSFFNCSASSNNWEKSLKYCFGGFK